MISGTLSNQVPAETSTRAVFNRTRSKSGNIKNLHGMVLQQMIAFFHFLNTSNNILIGKCPCSNSPLIFNVQNEKDQEVDRYVYIL